MLKLANLGAEQFFMKTENTKQGCLGSSELWSSKGFGIFSSKWETTVKITLERKKKYLLENNEILVWDVVHGNVKESIKKK